ncbi:MAG: glycosyltransferase [Ignavibacteriae bacterium]|jgi:hypothetical protein|nr:glycosyltransferase [Ignavibacteriota bacterium]
MNFLFIGNPASTLIQQLCYELKKNKNISIDIISTSFFDSQINYSNYFNNIYYLEDKYKLLRKIPYLKIIYFIYNLRSLLKKLPTYNAVSIHYVYYFYAFLIEDFKSKGNKIILSFWGSDFNSTNYWQKYFIRIAVNNADIITTANEEMKDRLIKKYKIPNEKCIIARFGLNILEIIKINFELLNKSNAKKYFKISDNFIITIGYNSNRNQQHIRIINEINSIKDKLPQNYILLFPLTYNFKNSSDYIALIQNKLIKYKLNYKFIDYYLTDIEVANLRVATDILIQLQKHDLFSGSMQEHFSAGSLVITGRWLPYQKFKDVGIYFREIEDFSKLNKLLLEAISNYNEENKLLKNNFIKVWNLSSWEKVISKWEHILGIIKN